MRRPFVHPAAILSGLVLVALVLACAGSPSASVAPPSRLAVGTWGADGAGVIVTASLVHVHIGCTNGDFALPATLDADGRFNVPGSYILRAYPVQIGPSLPARFAGVVRGSSLTLSVAVDDTVEKKLVALGPVTIVLGRAPNLGPCPICATAPR